MITKIGNNRKEFKVGNKNVYCKTAKSKEYLTDKYEVAAELAEIIACISAARIEKKLTKSKLSKMCHLTPPHLTNIELLDVSPNLLTLLRITHALGLKLYVGEKEKSNDGQGI